MALYGLPFRPAAADNGPTEYQVKAAFLYNFGKFVEWPADAFSSAPDLIITVVGDDPFDGTLERLVGGKSVQGRPIVIRHVRSVAELVATHIAFVSRSEAPHLTEVLKTLTGHPVLTVSDIPEFASRGGAIELGLEQNRVRFTINLKAAEQARLTISSQLLKVARSVRQ